MTVRVRALVHLNSGTPGQWWAAARWSCTGCRTYGTVGFSGPWPRDAWEIAARSAVEYAAALEDATRCCP